MVTRFPAGRRGIFRSAVCVLDAFVFSAAITAAASSQAPQIRLNSDATTEVQNEQQICVNPTDPDNLVACWRDFRLGNRRVAVGYSLDGGITWSDDLMPTQLGTNTDPVLVVDRNGTFYLAMLDLVWEGDNQILVFRSTDKGMTWDPPGQVSSYPGEFLHDKEWIAVDRTGGARDGHLYVAWTRYWDLTVLFSRSTDQGASWSEPVPLVDPPKMGWWVEPAVLANGDVLVAWLDASSSARTTWYDRSTDGGATWGEDQVLVSTVIAASEQLHGEIRTAPHASLAVDSSGGPRSGWVYCVYADRFLVGGGLQIFCVRSTDDGDTWSDAVPVNDDPLNSRDHFHPWLACDEFGTLTAIWYDRRDDPDNWAWHIYMAQSTDGGTSWSPNVRVTDVPSSPSDAGPGGRGAGLIGEYSGVATRNGVVYPIWTDTRNGNQDTYASRIVTGTPASVPAVIVDRWAGRLSAVPNPFRGATDLLWNDSGQQIRCVEILDVLGRRVRTFRLDPSRDGPRRLRFDGMDDRGRRLPTGLYLVRVREEGGLAPPTSRLVLQR